MLIKREHISGYAIHPSIRKSAAVAEMAARLHAAPESVLFIDDNPAEVRC